MAILFALCSFAFLFILGEEQDANLTTWFFRVIVDKALGFGAIIYASRLYKRWSKIDPWLMAYDKMCDEVMEKPNPTQL